MPKWECLICGGICYGWEGYYEWVSDEKFSICPYCKFEACAPQINNVKADLQGQQRLFGD